MSMKYKKRMRKPKELKTKTDIGWDIKLDPMFTTL